ncbi:hypothetical protein GCM10011359_16380 [Nesterenkonia alkaliphila]|nr:hypothetical protein GCM10011359_16380 [Nesterenkonia alkaliphila]
MALLMDRQSATVRDRILKLERPSLRPVEVSIQEDEGPEGPSVRVAVQLRNSATSPEWNADDFRALRRDARTIALEELGSEVSVRLLYEPEDGEDQPAHYSAGDKSF